jgi:beta-1,4-mannosyltransferase
MSNKQIKIRTYLYPISNRNNRNIYNPYLDNFISNTSNYLNYLNKKFPSDIGILNLYKFLHKTDLLLLNWIEDLPDKKGGVFQGILFLTLLKLKKFSRIKVIWTLHNKFSHNSSKLFLKKLLVSSLLKRSDIIITHSTEGIKFAEALHPGVSSRIFYFPHPVIPFKGPVKQVSDKKYDILIWGTLAPYKAIDIFLEFLAERNALNNYRILIVGKAVNPEFFMKLRKYESENIEIRNQFIENDELVSMIQQSKVTLFTYSGNSVLSSGALIDSISYGAVVFGPDTGAFAEMGHAGVIRTYESLENLFVLLEQMDQLDNSGIPERISEFVESHTWSKFSEAFREKLNLIDK